MSNYNEAVKRLRVAMVKRHALELAAVDGLYQNSSAPVPDKKFGFYFKRSKAFKQRLLALTGRKGSHQDEPFCTCGYCEDGRRDEEEAFQAIMAAAFADDSDHDPVREAAEDAALRASGRNLDMWRSEART